MNRDRAQLRFGYVLMAVSVAIYASCQMGMAWDGARFLFLVLDAQAPMIEHHRFPVLFFQLPPLLLSRLTENIDLLAAVFSALFLLPALISLWLCERILRGEPSRERLLLWPAISLAFPTIFGQVAYTESIAAIQLFWPLFLLALTGARRRPWLAVTLAVVVFFLHGVASALFLAGGAILIVAATIRRTRHLAATGSCFLGLGLLKLGIAASGYERSYQSVWATLQLDRLQPWALLGLFPFLALCLSFVFPGVVAGRLPRGLRLPRLQLLALALGGLSVLVWAAIHQNWIEGGYRLTAFYFTVPIFFMAMLDTGKGSAETRSGCVLACCAIFASVVSVESARWWKVQRAFRETLKASACVRLQEHPELQHPGLTVGRSHLNPAYLGIITQGTRRPSSVLIYDPKAACEDPEFRKTIWMAPWHPRSRDSGGWFDLTSAGLGPKTTPESRP